MNMRSIFRFILLATALLPARPLPAAKELEGRHAAAAGPCPTVEEAIAKMSVPDGYAVRCFASEPMVINPVAMTWDHRGRLWVVELYEYPNGAAKPNAYSRTAADEEFRPVIPQEKDSPRDRVIILEDTDNNGTADKRTVFAEGLNLATAILCGHGGVFVGQAPNLFFFRDTDGDDKADDYKTVLTGFGLEDRHELLNSFTWGPDGWMYLTHGVFTHSKVRRPEQKPEEGFTLNAGIFRVKLEQQPVARPVPALTPEPQPPERPSSTSKPNAQAATTAPADKETDAKAAADSPALPKAGTGLATGPVAADYEVYADGTSNPWGVDFDARGNAFIEACVIDHFFHMAPGGLYARQGGAPENPYAYELLPSIVGKDHPRHFRAAYAGIAIYQGGIYPADTHGHAFFGNIHDNAIHEEAMDPVGATFKARPIRDFLRANDGWFRPVSIQTGPDGFLWVMDWCDKYPCYQNALANPAGVDREKGRIWRVCYTGSPEGKDLAAKSRPVKDMNLAGLSFSKKLSLVSHANKWMSKAAFIPPFISDGDDDPQTIKSGLFQLATSSAPLEQRLKALHSLFMISPDFKHLVLPKPDQKFEDLAKSTDPEVRQQVARAIANLPFAKTDLDYNFILSKIASDPDPIIRHSVAIALRKWRMGNALTTNTADRDGPQELVILADLIKASANTPDSTLPFAIWMAVEPEMALRPKAWLELFAGVAPTTKPLSLTLTNKSARRIIDTRSPTNVDLLLTFLDRIKDHDDLTAAALEGILKASEAGPVKPDKTDPAPFFVRWSQSASSDVKNRAAAEVGSGDEFSTPVLKLWPKGSPALHTAAAQFLTGRIEWQQRLLATVEKPDPATGIRIPASELPATTRRYFATSSDPAIRATAERVIGRWSDSTAETKALIAAKRKALIEGEPDLAQGKVLFQALCATCHKFHGGGQEVGPDLIGSGRSNLDAILANVIDPNQIIGNGYQNFLITTKDGRTLGGRIVEDTPTQVTLLGIGGSREVVPTADIAKKEDTGLSLMPMGFGSLPDDQLRNLIWYLLAPPEEGPLTHETKKALIQGEGG